MMVQDQASTLPSGSPAMISSLFAHFRRLISRRTALLLLLISQHNPCRKKPYQPLQNLINPCRKKPHHERVSKLGPGQTCTRPKSGTERNATWTAAGRGGHIMATAVTTPRVPSPPMNSCFRSYLHWKMHHSSFAWRVRLF